MKAFVAAKFLELFSLLLICLQVGLIGGAIYAESKTHKAGMTRFDSVRLSEQLRHSSRDLTTAARGYVATADLRYWNEFHLILDVRNGVKPRSDGRTVPLRALLAEAGFKETELGLMDIAEKKSDELTKIEIQAMELVKNSNKKDQAENMRKAIEQIYSSNYRQNVREIMEPIIRFEDSVNQRTFELAQTYDFVLRTLLILIGVLLLVSGYVFYVLVEFKIGNSKREV